MNNVDLTRYKRIVQYFWDPEPKNSDDSDSPIWCLGSEYPPERLDGHEKPSSTAAADKSSKNTSTTQEDSEPEDSGILVAAAGPGASEPNGESQRQHDVDGGWPSAFLDDFESRAWLTYRSNFPPIPKSQDPNAAAAMTLSVRLRSQLVDSQGFTSDTGWGCMIRSGQSLLANTLMTLKLGRDWRIGSRPEDEKKLLSLFADDPRAPFSIHRFVEHGASVCGKHPGEWFGPSATARCIQDLSTECKEAGLNVYVTSDSSDVYEDRFMKIARSDTGEFRPTLILLGIRLGIDRVTPVYWEALKAALQYPQSIGIAGGRPSASHYFVGVQGPYFFYLDPHHTRPALPFHESVQEYTSEEILSCHTRRLRRLHIKEMDPSMLMGFLIREEEDWKSWRRSVTEVQGKPIIHVFDGEPSLHGGSNEREGAVDEVETLSDENDE